MPSSDRRALLAAAVIFLSFFGYYSGTALPIFRDALQACFQLDMRQFGLLLSCGSVASAAGSLLAGLLVYRHQAQILLRIALIGLGSAALLAAVSLQIWMLATAVILMGVCNGALYLLVQTYLIRLYPDNPRRIVSVQLISVSAAAIVFSVLAEQLLRMCGSGQAGLPTFTQVLHWPYACIALLVLPGALVLRCPGDAAPAHRSVHDPESGGDWRRLLLFSAAGWWLMTLIILHSTADATASLWMPRVLGSARNFAVRSLQPGYVMAAMGAVYVVSRLLLALAPTRAGGRVLLVLPGLLGGGLFFASLFTHSQALVSGGYVLGSFIWSVEYPVLLTVLADVEQRRYAAAAAITLLISGLFTVLASSLVGGLGDRFGESSLWAAMLIPASMYMVVGAGGSAYLLATRQLGARAAGQR